MRALSTARLSLPVDLETSTVLASDLGPCKYCQEICPTRTATFAGFCAISIPSRCLCRVCGRSPHSLPPGTTSSACLSLFKHKWKVVCLLSELFKASGTQLCQMQTFKTFQNIKRTKSRCRSTFSCPLAMLSAISDGSSSSRRYWWHRSVANPPNRHGSSRSSTRLRRSLEHNEPRCRPLLGSCPNDHAYATTDDPKWSNFVPCASSTPSMLCAQNGCAFGTCLSCENGLSCLGILRCFQRSPPGNLEKHRTWKHNMPQYVHVRNQNFALAVGSLQTRWHGDMQINLILDIVPKCPKQSLESAHTFVAFFSVFFPPSMWDEMPSTRSCSATRFWSCLTSLPIWRPTTLALEMPPPLSCKESCSWCTSVEMKDIKKFYPNLE